MPLSFIAPAATVSIGILIVVLGIVALVLALAFLWLSRNGRGSSRR